MNKSAVGIVVGVGLLVGCQGGRGGSPTPGAGSVGTPVNAGGGGTGAGAGSPAPSAGAAQGKPATDTPVARVAGRTITERQLRDPLVEAYGLNVLLNLVQLELAQREAERANVSVTEADVTAERQRTVARMFEQSNGPQLEKIEATRLTDPTGADRMLAELRNDNEQALDQLLAQQRVSRPEFETVIRTNATMRKVAEPEVDGAITDEKLRDSFRVQYGEKVVVRHIQTGSLTDLNAARRRLATGEAFEEVARAVSTNRSTGPLGGEVPPFTRNNEAFPQSFRDAAFGLKVGEVSEAVNAEGVWHVIKLEQRVDPTVVKFEDVKESLRTNLREMLIATGVRNLRQQIGQDALAGLSIDDPILKRQFDAKLEQQQSKVRDRDAVREQLSRQREAMVAQQAEELAATTRAAATQATTGPATAEATTGATTAATTRSATTSTTPSTTDPTTTAATGPTGVPSPTTAPTGAVTRPATTFVDDLLPSTLPVPMKSAMPEANLSTTRPVSTTTQPATPPAGMP